MRIIFILATLFAWQVPAMHFAGEIVKVPAIDSAANARQPQLAIDATGKIHLAFGAENGIFYACSTNTGKSFQKPTLVGWPKTMALGMRRGPRIAATENALVITAIGGDLGGGRDGDLCAWRSVDSGVTWSEPVLVNDVNRSAREGLHAMAGGPSGEIFCVWLDLRNKGTELWGANSTDNGKTWSKNILVYQSPDGSICECCHPSVSYDAKGKLHVLWRNSWKGNRDMFTAVSIDGGKSFAPAARLGEQEWSLDACPMDGGMLAVTSQGELATIWRRDKQIITTAENPRREQMLAQGMQPWIAATAEGVYRVWISKRPGDLFLLPPGTKEPEKIAAHAADPVIAANPAKGTPVVVAWETEEDGHPVIYTKVITATAEQHEKE